MGKLSSLLWGTAIGAGLMYFYDPQNGNRRKALLRDQISHLRSQGDEALDVAVHDLRNRAKGLLAEGMSMVSGEDVPDQVIEARANSRLGYFTRHPGAINVSVQNGAVTLSGDALTDEVDHIVQGLGRVRGIRRVENNLRVHQEAGNIPHLQGEGWLPGQNGQWAPSTRLLVGIGAGYLMLYSIFRGGLIGFFARLGGLAIGARALTNMDMSKMTGMTQQGDAIRVRKGIQINAPVEDVYTLWSNFENFPRFMSNVEAIHNRGKDRSHWVVKGPAGTKVEFEAIETQNIPNELIAWETTPDSQVKHRGQVRFRESGQNRTQVQVNMSYTPPAGVAGAAVAALFGKDPKTEMDADLARMKSLLEEGKTRTTGKKVTRDEVMPVTGRGGRPSSMRSEHESNPMSSETDPETGGFREGESNQPNRGTTGGMEPGGTGSSGPVIPPGE